MAKPIEVKGFTGWKIRFQIAFMLIRLASWISGTSFQIVTDEGADEHDHDTITTARSKTEDPGDQH